MDAAVDGQICMSTVWRGRGGRAKEVVVVVVEEVGGGKDRKEKTRISTIHPPLIFSMYNIKAITASLCQRVWNNRLVSEGEMR